MIAGIKKSGSFNKIISYNEKKVEEGTAKLLSNSTFSETTDEKIQYMMDVVSENKNTKNKSQHIYISLPPGENLDDKTIRELSLSYLEKMGYSNAPHLIYRHFDTDKEHLHIVTTTVNLDGVWMSTDNDFRRSQKISRALEKEYGLQPTVQNKENISSKQLSEINAYKHSIQKAINQKISEPYFLDHLTKLIPQKILIKIRQNPSFSDNQISHEFFKHNQGPQYFQLQQFLLQHNLIYKLKKDILLDKLKYLKSISKNYDGFKNNLEKQGLYIKEKITNKGKTLVYGDSNESIYISHKQQPKAFQYGQIVALTPKTNSPTIAAQKKYLKSSIKKALYKCTSLKELEFNLQKVNIELTYSSNKSGITGISFKSNGIESAETFKGSQLNYSINTINQIISKNTTYEKLANKQKAKIPTKKLSSDLKSIGKQMDTGQDSEDQDDSLKNSKSF